MKSTDLDTWGRDVREILDLTYDQHKDWMTAAAKRIVDHLFPAQLPSDLGADRIVLAYCGDGSVEAVFFPKGPRAEARRVGGLDEEYEELAKTLHAHVEQLPKAGGPSALESLRQAFRQGQGDTTPLIP